MHGDLNEMTDYKSEMEKCLCCKRGTQPAWADQRGRDGTVLVTQVREGAQETQFRGSVRPW